MLQDLRLKNFNRTDFRGDAYLVPMDKQNEPAETLCQFQDCFDGLYFFTRPDDDTKQNFIADLRQLSTEYDDDAWQYMTEINNVYQDCGLCGDVYRQSLTALAASENEWFSWVASIPYEGIQSLLLSMIPSMEGLQSFLEFLAKNEPPADNLQKRVRLLVRLIVEFREKLKIVKINIDLQRRRYPAEFKLTNDILQKWEREDIERAEKFAQTFCNFPHEQQSPVFFAVMNNFWNTAEANFSPYSGLLRNEIIAATAQKFRDEKDISALLQDHAWKLNKSAVLHKLLLYANRATNFHADLSKCRDNLWQDVKKLLADKIHFNYRQQDDLLFPWLCSKLPADDNEPQKRLEDALRDYHTRIGGWKFDYENFAQQRRSQFFLLIVGAMSAERLHYENVARARELFDYVFSEGHRLIDEFHYETPDELQFLGQSWRRRALFLTEPISEQEQSDMLSALKLIDSLNFKLNAINNFLLNLDEKQKRDSRNQSFWYAVMQILNDDLAFEEHRDEHFDKAIQNMRKNIAKIKAQIVATR